MKNPLLRLAPAIALAAPLALGFYARPAAQAPPQSPPAQPAPQTPNQPPSSDQAPATPTFRGGIDLVRVDVSVSDKQGNPVTDLRQQDFEVTEDGKPQAIQTFKLVDIKEATRTESSAVPVSRRIKTVADEQMQAAKDEVRLFGIFLDDYHVRKENSIRAREVIAQFVENQLQPSDMVGIMYPLTPLADVLMGQDHANAASAIRSFLGRKYDYTPKNLFEEYANYISTMEAERIRNDVSLSAIKGMIVHMGGLKEGRKMLILVTEGWANTLPSQAQDPIAAQPQPGMRPLDPVQGKSNREQSQDFFLQTEMMSDIKLVFEMANKYNTMIYTVDPRGLAPFEFDLSRSNVSLSADHAALENTLDTLRVLAAETGGRAIINQNDLDTGLKQIIRDSSAYYLLGYTTTQNAVDGRFHQIKVNVKRPNLQVRARKGYLALTAAEAERAIAPPKPGPAKAITEALGNLAIPARRSVIRTWIGMSPGSNGKTKVTFVWEPTPPAPGVRTETPARVSLVAGSPNADLYFRGKVPGDTLPARAEFEVPPGPIDLEIAVEDANAEVIDREPRKLIVPSLGLGLTLSTPALFRARTLREWQTLAAEPNPVPMPEREFRRTDHLLVRVAAQSAGGTAPTITARLLNRDGGEMNPLTTASSPVAGVSNVDVPLANLPTGEFLIEINASDGGEKTSALVAIRIVS